MDEARALGGKATKRRAKPAGSSPGRAFTASNLLPLSNDVGSSRVHSDGLDTAELGQIDDPFTKLHLERAIHLGGKNICMGKVEYCKRCIL